MPPSKAKPGQKAPAGNRMYILYDGRACGGQGTDDATVLVACSSDREARGYKGDYGQMACYSYAVNGQELSDERWEWDHE